MNQFFDWLKLLVIWRIDQKIIQLKRRGFFGDRVGIIIDDIGIVISRTVDMNRYRCLILKLIGTINSVASLRSWSLKVAADNLLIRLKRQNLRAVVPRVIEQQLTQWPLRINLNCMLFHILWFKYSFWKVSDRSSSTIRLTSAGSFVVTVIVSCSFSAVHPANKRSHRHHSLRFIFSLAVLFLIITKYSV